ncbi:hypothetical protein JYU34_003970 [Plutella xylostella]|uniref:Uncharacterized protein n=1 Tax=Plutella xylostella TaxID=51655 RepID=A0ABQ7R1E5_PLUXY|nr:hypothetical protein JYU34_003970 [Plutella xylostella]
MRGTSSVGGGYLQHEVVDAGRAGRARRLRLGQGGSERVRHRYQDTASVLLKIKKIKKSLLPAKPKKNCPG